MCDLSPVTKFTPKLTQIPCITTHLNDYFPGTEAVFILHVLWEYVFHMKGYSKYTMNQGQTWYRQIVMTLFLFLHNQLPILFLRPIPPCYTLYFIQWFWHQLTFPRIPHFAPCDCEIRAQPSVHDSVRSSGPCPGRPTTDSSIQGQPPYCDFIERMWPDRVWVQKGCIFVEGPVLSSGYFVCMGLMGCWVRSHCEWAGRIYGARWWGDTTLEQTPLFPWTFSYFQCEVSMLSLVNNSLHEWFQSSVVQKVSASEAIHSSGSSLNWDTTSCF